MPKLEPDRVVAGDSIKLLTVLKEPIADLIFADPPFHIGYQYAAMRFLPGLDDMAAAS